MASKPSQPALYEKMRTRSISAQPVTTKIDIPPSASTDVQGPNWLSPGRMLRVPVGYVLLGCAICLMLVFLAYMWGVKRGTAIERNATDQQIISANSGVNDPLAGLQPVVDPNNSRVLGGGAGTNRPSISSDPAGWGPVAPSKDPRQKGLNYFILAETNESGALTLADFCRKQGLETYVISGKNERLRKIVAFPGFEAAARSSPAVKALEAQIHSVGDKWKKNKGVTDFRDAYPALYGG